MKINQEWLRENLWALCYAWERGAGNILSSGTDASNELVRLLTAELEYAGNDLREGEWESEIAKIVEAEDESKLLELVQWIATDSKSAAAVLAKKGRAEHEPTEAQREAARINGRKGGRPKGHKPR